MVLVIDWFFFFQAEDGIRDLVRSRGLGDVYKRQSGYRSGIHDRQYRACEDGAMALLRVSVPVTTLWTLSLIHI